MFIVYVLFSKSSGRIYIGFTGNLEARLISHNQLGKKGWSIKFRPWLVVYSEEFSTKTAAMLREKELKSARGREFIRNLIEE